MVVVYHRETGRVVLTHQAHALGGASPLSLEDLTLVALTDAESATGVPRDELAAMSPRRGGLPAGGVARVDSRGRLVPAPQEHLGIPLP